MSADTAQAAENSPEEIEEPLSFDSMPLSPDVRKSLAEMGYERPTPVQAAVFEVAKSGRDAIVQARTGTGKTSAFGLPLVDSLVGKDAGAQALVLCPTRELALQVSREVDKLGKHRGITTVAVYGGAAIGKQMDQINRGAQIVVGTPGRTLDHLRRRTLDPKGIKTLVLDESDEMLSMGFERELSAIIEHLPEDRQTLLFSATLPPDTERLAKGKLRDPELVILSGDHIGALSIEHYVYMVSSDKIGAMKHVLENENPESAVIFCNTKDMTERLATALQREGYESAWLNGDLPQNDREIVMRKTREGKLRFLVATDVAARGIDISHLTHVINFDFPQDAEAYVHRTGRTGRAGNTGTALSLITPQDIGGLYMLRLTYKIRPVERHLPSRTEQRTRVEADIVTSLASTFAVRGKSPEHRALARRLLTHDDAEAILAGILREHLSSNPELPELAQSRRRGKTPPPASPPARERGKRERKPRERKRDRVSQSDRAPAGDGAPADRAADDRASSDDRASKAEPSKAEPSKEPSKAEPSKAEKAGRTGADDRGRKADRAEADSKGGRTREGDRRERGRGSRQDRSDDARKSTDDDARESGSRRQRRPKREEVAQGDADGAPADTSPSRSSSRTRSTQPSAGSANADRRSSGRADAEVHNADEVELHIDAGRRDGARVQALKSILADGGVSLDDVRRVRVRERYTFVEVVTAARDAAIEAITGASLGDRTLTAKISERSAKPASS